MFSTEANFSVLGFGAARAAHGGIAHIFGDAHAHLLLVIVVNLPVAFALHALHEFGVAFILELLAICGAAFKRQKYEFLPNQG